MTKQPADPSSGTRIPQSTTDSTVCAIAMAQASVDRDAPRPLSADFSLDHDLEGLASVLAMLGAVAEDEAATRDSGIFMLGRFEVLGERGRGGFGIVLHALDPHLQRHVALKLPRPDRLLDGQPPSAIVREAQLAAHLDHPGIVPVYETGTLGPVWYIASAYCDGPTLGEWLDQLTDPPPPRVAAEIMKAAADALHYAHSRGVLHLDLKPENILLKWENSETLVPRPLLTDFGLAGWCADGAGQQPGRIAGTEAYMAPEQRRGEATQIGVATDVYALGAILQDLLTPPCQNLSDGISNSRVASQLDLAAIAAKCLAETPEARYGSASEVADELTRYLKGETVLARPGRWPMRLARWSQRHPAFASLITVLAATIMVSVVALTVLWRRAEGHLARFDAEAQLRQAADQHMVDSLLNLAMVAQQSRLRSFDEHVDASVSIEALRELLDKLRGWQVGDESREISLAAATKSLATVAVLTVDDSCAFDATFREGLIGWIGVLKREPDSPQWARALAAHLVTHHLHHRRRVRPSWGLAEFDLPDAVMKQVEVPYAELLITLADERLRRRNADPGYGMLGAAVAIVEAASADSVDEDHRRQLLLAAYARLAEAADLLSLASEAVAYRASAAQIVAEVPSPANCSPSLARTVAAVLGDQAAERFRASDWQDAVAIHERATKYQRRAFPVYAGDPTFISEYAGCHGRAANYLRRHGQHVAADRAADAAVEVLDAAIERLPPGQRSLLLQRAVLHARLAEAFLLHEDERAYDALKRAAADFARIDLRRADSRGTWYVAIRALQSLGRLEASAARPEAAAAAYRESLRLVGKMKAFTRSARLNDFAENGEQAVTKLAAAANPVPRPN